ncbi:MAG: hypothetical protein IPK60_04340 [Sandaracinaceae bacterium]|nr:hypothetical protein [Sandaracinaceae bacterium]
MTRLIVLALFACFGIAACSNSPQPALEVQVVTGLVPGPEFASVLTEVSPGTGTTAGTIVPLRVPVVFGREFAAGRSVATFPNLAHGIYTVWVHLYRPNGQILIERRVQINYTGSYVLRVHLTRDCLPSVITCPEPGGSPEYTECLEGRCVDPRCNPQDEATRVYCPSVAFCLNDAECTDPVAACAMNKCVSGICTPTQVEGTCATQWCDPDTSGGCMPLQEPDAGTDAGFEMDAGIEMGVGRDAGLALDEGVDANLSCGEECDPEAQPCFKGVWECEGSAQTCVATADTEPYGTPCGDGLMCNLLHDCVENCLDDTSCALPSDPCAAASINCDTGACEAIVPASRKAPGSPCATDAVCNDASECVSCISDVPCSVGGCRSGFVDCFSSGTASCAPCDSGGSCVTGNAPAGTACRVDSEACVGDSCTPDAICAPLSEGGRLGMAALDCAFPGDACTAACRVGNISEDGVCVTRLSSFAPEGTPCGTSGFDSCDAAGNCVTG